MFLDLLHSNQKQDQFDVRYILVLQKMYLHFSFLFYMIHIPNFEQHNFYICLLYETMLHLFQHLFDSVADSDPAEKF